jgi:glycosyltransferase involved in cell wall biosynthesis
MAKGFNDSMYRMDKVKVLLIARRFPPSVGGMERFAYDLSTALVGKVDLRTITYGGSNKWLPLVLPWFTLKALWVLLKYRNIDVIHMQDAVQAPIGWLLSKLFNKPYVVVAHGLDITFEKAFYQKLVLPFVRKANAVISISTATNDEVLHRGVSESNTRVVTLGTHDDYNGKPVSDRLALQNELGLELGDSSLLLTTGRLVKRKGVAWFIREALPGVAKQNGDVLYLVAGEGGERPAIERAIASAGMEDHVRLLGRVSDKARTLLYQSCDIFVMPNIVVAGDMEGFGIVAHEAATAGKPVVASDLEGIKDALRDGKNGILLPNRDNEAFVRELTKLIGDPNYRKEFGERARSYTLKEYSWDAIADEYIKIYETLV